MIKTVVLGFGFMGKTHTGNILKNPVAQLVAIVDKNRENIPKNLHIKIEGGNTFHTAYPFQAGYSARFENASVIYYPKDLENIIVTTDTETTIVPAGDANDGFSGELDYFIKCISENEKPEKCSPESALESIRICYRHINKLIYFEFG